MTQSKSNPGVFEGKKVEYSAMTKSISWSQPDWAAFHLLKTKLKAERPTNKQQMKSAAVKAWKSITKDCLQTILNKILKMNILFMITYLSNYISAPENGGTVYKNGCNF